MRMLCRPGAIVVSGKEDMGPNKVAFMPAVSFDV